MAGRFVVKKSPLSRHRAVAGTVCDHPSIRSAARAEEQTLRSRIIEVVQHESNIGRRILFNVQPRQGTGGADADVAGRCDAQQVTGK